MCDLLIFIFALGDFLLEFIILEPLASYYVLQSTARIFMTSWLPKSIPSSRIAHLFVCVLLLFFFWGGGALVHLVSYEISVGEI